MKRSVASRTGRPDGSVVEVRYPFVEVDGLSLRIEADGRVSQCGYVHAAVDLHVTCGETETEPR